MKRIASQLPLLQYSHISMWIILFFVIKKPCIMVHTRVLCFNAKEVGNKSNYFHTSLSQLIAYCCHQHEVICTAQACRCDHLCQATAKHSSVPEEGRECTLRNFAGDSKLKGSSQYAGGQRDLGRLNRWADRNLMNLNKGKILNLEWNNLMQWVQSVEHLGWKNLEGLKNR